MQPTVILTLAAHGVAKTTKRPAASSPPAPTTVRRKSSGHRAGLRVLAALAGSFLLVISLVDPLSGRDQPEASNAALGGVAPHAASTAAG